MEFVLNDMGLLVEYWDLDEKPFTLQDAKQLEVNGFRGLLTCFLNENMPKASELMQAIKNYSNAKLPWAALCRMGFDDILKLQTPERQNTFWKPWGVRVDRTVESGWTRFARNEKFNFEQNFSEPRDVFPMISLGSTRHKIWASAISKPSQTQSKLASKALPKIQAMTSDRFSFAYGYWGLQFANLGDFRHAWNIDPYFFFSEAFQWGAEIPVPDVNVLNGNRVFLSHIDADGFHAIAKNKFGFSSTQSCGEVLEKQVLTQYPSLPFGVSVIMSEVLPEEEGSEYTEKAAHKNFFFA